MSCTTGTARLTAHYWKHWDGSGAAPFPDGWLKSENDEGLRDFMYRDEYRLRDRNARRERGSGQ